MKPRRGDSNFDPFDGLPEDPFAMVSREVRHPWGADEDVNIVDQEKRLPRPSMARDRFRPRANSIGQGNRDR